MHGKGSKEKYRRIIKRKIFWEKHKDAVTVLLLILIAVLALGIAGIWRKLEDQREAEEIRKRLSQIKAGDDYSQSLCMTDPDAIPAYAGEDWVTLEGGMPGFCLYDIQNVEGENYSALDALGRCGPAVVMLHESMMPDKERESIGEIKPTGWVQHKYEGVVASNPPYLYNRCHLIAFALTGQNANERNLITGTRHFNADGMLPWEIKVMEYLEKCDNHVLYRVTPYFKGDELLARGVEMEAYSIEDAGKGVCFHVFVYNVQPGIEIDYATGENRLAKE